MGIFGDILKPFAEIGGDVLDVFSGPLDKLTGRDLNREQFERNIALQREFAQNGIRWKVEDARRAGLHPLAAIGASGASYSPVGVVGADTPMNAIESAARMGQNISRAVSATSTEQEKEMQALQLASARLDVEGKAIDNQIRASHLATTRQAGGNPPMAGSTNFIPGQGNSGVMRVKPGERTASQPGRLAQEAGWVPDVGFARTDTGLTPVPSKDVKERIEDQLIPELMWAVRNQLAPNFGLGTPPRSQLPRGASRWKWNYLKQEWQPDYNSGKSIPFGGYLNK